MMPNLSRFHIVIWLLVMCPSCGVKWPSFRWCSRQQFSYRIKNRERRSGNLEGTALGEAGEERCVSGDKGRRKNSTTAGS